MRFGGTVAPNSGCLRLTLGLCSSFSFGVVSVLHLTHSLDSLTHSLTHLLRHFSTVEGAMKLKFASFCSS